MSLVSGAGHLSKTASSVTKWSIRADQSFRRSLDSLFVSLIAVLPAI
jgi:hypothetical protein